MGTFVGHVSHLGTRKGASSWNRDIEFLPGSRNSCIFNLSCLSTPEEDIVSRFISIPLTVIEHVESSKALLDGPQCRLRNSTAGLWSILISWYPEERWPLLQDVGVTFWEESFRRSYISFRIRERLKEASEGINQFAVSWKGPKWNKI